MTPQDLEEVNIVTAFKILQEENKSTQKMLLKIWKLLSQHIEDAKREYWQHKDQQARNREKCW